MAKASFSIVVHDIQNWAEVLSNVFVLSLQIPEHEYSDFLDSLIKLLTL